MTEDGGRMPLPGPRGPVSAGLLELLPQEPSERAGVDLAERLEPHLDALLDEDLQLSLLVLYELHYRGLRGVDDRWEWAPGLLAARAALEARVERALDERLAPVPAVRTPGGLLEVLEEITRPDPSGSLSSFVARRAGIEQVRELVTHRSVYVLKEADPHTWAVPRLHGPPKAALVEIQADEYGGGRPEWVHATLYARAMRGLGLDDSYGALVDLVPAVSLAVVNVMSLFGLHRHHRAACVGHLAAFEMTSTHPNRRYAQGLRRLGLGPDVTAYFDEHVEADAVHEQVAGHDLVGGLVRQDPSLVPDVLRGARAALLVDDLVAEHLLGAWAGGRSALRAPASAAALEFSA